MHTTSQLLLFLLPSPPGSFISFLSQHLCPQVFSPQFVLFGVEGVERAGVSELGGSASNPASSVISLSSFSKSEIFLTLTYKMGAVRSMSQSRCKNKLNSQQKGNWPYSRDSTRATKLVCSLPMPSALMWETQRLWRPYLVLSLETVTKPVASSKCPVPPSHVQAAFRARAEQQCRHQCSSGFPGSSSQGHPPSAQSPRGPAR